MSLADAPVVRLEKVKRPGGVFWYDLHLLGEDRHGTWLHGPVGSPWGAPHDSGGLPVPVAVLLRPLRPAVVWWVDDPDDPRVEVDVCLPPEPHGGTWRYVDLELDPVLHLRDDRVEVEDRDEFREACRLGHMTAADAEVAAGAAAHFAGVLQLQREEWLHLGWDHLAAAAPPE